MVWFCWVKSASWLFWYLRWMVQSFMHWFGQVCFVAMYFKKARTFVSGTTEGRCEATSALFWMAGYLPFFVATMSLSFYEVIMEQTSHPSVKERTFEPCFRCLLFWHFLCCFCMKQSEHTFSERLTYLDFGATNQRRIPITHAPIMYEIYM